MSIKTFMGWVHFEKDHLVQAALYLINLRKPHGKRAILNTAKTRLLASGSDSYFDSYWLDVYQELELPSAQHLQAIKVVERIWPDLV